MKKFILAAAAVATLSSANAAFSRVNNIDNFQSDTRAEITSQDSGAGFISSGSVDCRAFNENRVRSSCTFQFSRAAGESLGSAFPGLHAPSWGLTVRVGLQSYQSISIRDLHRRVEQAATRNRPDTVLQTFPRSNNYGTFKLQTIYIVDGRDDSTPEATSTGNPRNANIKGNAVYADGTTYRRYFDFLEVPATDVITPRTNGIRQTHAESGETVNGTSRSIEVKGYADPGNNFEASTRWVHHYYSINPKDPSIQPTALFLSDSTRAFPEEATIQHHTYRYTPREVEGVIDTIRNVRIEREAGSNIPRLIPHSVDGTPEGTVTYETSLDDTPSIHWQVHRLDQPTRIAFPGADEQSALLRQWDLDNPMHGGYRVDFTSEASLRSDGVTVVDVTIHKNMLHSFAPRAELAYLICQAIPTVTAAGAPISYPDLTDTSLCTNTFGVSEVPLTITLTQ